MNLQVIASPGGDILWVSGPLPGAVHDLTAARIWGIVRDLAAAGLVVLADKGYHGAGEYIRTPRKGKGKPESQKAANRAHARLRSPGERANAQLKPGASCENSAAAPGRPGTWPKPSTYFKPARTKDEARSVSRLAA
jgi:DDE superfamily endonuclease